MRSSAKNATPDNTNWGGKLCTVDLLFKVVCFVKDSNNIFDKKIF